MTDWKLVAKSRGLELPESHLATLTQLEAVMAELKRKLPFDGEPAVVLHPVMTPREAGK